MQIDTRCGHLRNPKIPLEVRVDDHKPLTFEGLKSLLTAAVAANCQQRAKIQVRLNQAISGMTCPRPIHGSVAGWASELNRLYVLTLRNDPKYLPQRALEFWVIFQASAA